MVYTVQQVRALRKETDSVNPREGIVKALREHPEGLTIKDIAGLTGSHRHTITKYVYELIGARVILERDIGAAKLCYLMETYMGKEAQAAGAMKGSLGFRQSWKGQAQLLTLFIALLLVPAGMIAAQSFGNSTATDGMAVAADGVHEVVDGNVTGEFLEADVPATGTALTQASGETPGAEETAPEIPPADETVPGEETDAVTANETVEVQSNETLPEEDININITESNETAQEENITMPDGNVTFPETNETIPGENGTVPQANETIPEINITPSGTAAIEILVENPARITRGEDFTARVVIRNAGDGSAENAVLEWVLPEGFEVISGSAVESIGTIAAGEEKAYEIVVRTSTATSRGTAEIRARVTYE
jgi:uncharacterized repeat protein (TIGR01451 family)